MPLLHSLLHRLRLLAFAWRRRATALAGACLGEGVEIGPDCEVVPGLAPPRRGRVSIGDRCRLEGGVTLHPYGGSISLGRDVFLGPGVVIYGHGGVEIGDDCLIAMHCRILSSEHAIPPLGTPIRSRADLIKPTRIGRDVWLGAGVTVLGGVTVGDGCVVGAGAVVTRDLPSGAIALGVPARVVEYRPRTTSQATSTTGP